MEIYIRLSNSYNPTISANIHIWSLQSNSVHIRAYLFKNNRVQDIWAAAGCSVVSRLKPFCAYWSREQASATDTWKKHTIKHSPAFSTWCSANGNAAAHMTRCKARKYTTRDDRSNMSYCKQSRLLITNYRFKNFILVFGICVERFGFMTCIIYSCIHVIKKIISQKSQIPYSAT